MDDDFVADSEGEGDLTFSPVPSVSKVLDASPNVQPNTNSYSLSSISQYTSTVNTTAIPILNSPIVDFTAVPRVSSVKKTVPKKRDSAPIIIDLSGSEDEPVFPPARKIKAPPPKKKSKEDKKGKKVKKALGESADDDDFSVVGSQESIPKKVTKSRKSIAKKQLSDYEDSVPEPAQARSKKRKSLEEEDYSAAKRSKKRKKGSPGMEDADGQTMAEPDRKKKKSRRVIAEDDESPDELLLTNDTPQSPKKVIVPKLVKRSTSSLLEDVDVEEVVEPPAPSPSHKSTSARSASESSVPPVAPPKPPPAAKAAPRLSSESRPMHVIPKRGSVSDILHKTGHHAPLSSAKLTRKVGGRIAPLHITRKTPPPPPPPIPKPKKKVVEEDEDEDDFTGMTQKQIAKIMEERKNKAWYSP